MRYVTDGANEAGRPGGLKWKAVLGFFWLAVSYQTARDHPDIRALAAYVSGSIAALLIWARQIHVRRLTWWKTGLLAACATVGALAVALYVVGGDQIELGQFIAEWGPETALLVAFGPAAALHLISDGLGWGQGEGAASDGPSALDRGDDDADSDVARSFGEGQ